MKGCEAVRNPVQQSHAAPAHSLSLLCPAHATCYGVRRWEIAPAAAASAFRFGIAAVVVVVVVVVVVAVAGVQAGEDLNRWARLAESALLCSLASAAVVMVVVMVVRVEVAAAEVWIVKVAIVLAVQSKQVQQ